MQAIQVDLVATSLHSSHCYVLHDGEFIFTWRGSLALVNDYNLLDKMLDFIDGKEIFSFTQDDLTTEDVFILHYCSEIYVWVRKRANLLSKQQAFALGKMHGNSFERKLAILNGLAPKVETPRNSFISSQRCSSTYEHANSRGKLFSSDGSKVRSGSPALSASPSSKPPKTHHLTPTMAAREICSGSPHTDGSSDALPVKGGQNSILEKLGTILLEDDGSETGLGLKVYPYELLKVLSDLTAEDIDVTKREAYLSSEEFHQLFRMTKKAFYMLPKWRQNKLKMAVNLF